MVGRTGPPGRAPPEKASGFSDTSTSVPEVNGDLWSSRFHVIPLYLSRGAWRSPESFYQARDNGKRRIEGSSLYPEDLPPVKPKVYLTPDGSVEAGCVLGHKRGRMPRPGGPVLATMLLPEHPVLGAPSNGCLW